LVDKLRSKAGVQVECKEKVEVGAARSGCGEGVKTFGVGGDIGGRR
jgi:hypothetical protein